MNFFRFCSAVMVMAVVIGFSSCKEDEAGEKPVEFEVSPGELTAGNGAETYEIQITAGGAWTATAYNSWCTVSPESGTGNATLTVKLSENTMGENRSTTIEIESKGSGGKSVSKEIAVTQLAYIPFISVNKPEVTVSSEATTLEVVVKTNLPLFYLTLPLIPGWDGPKDASNRDIKSYKKPDGAGSEWEQTVRFTLAENSRSVAIEGSIVFGNSNQTISTSLKITHAAPDYAFFAANGGQEQKEALSGSWTATSNATWCTVSQSGSGGNVSITVTENPDRLPRNTTVTIASADKTKKILVAQEPKVVIDRSQTWTDAGGTRYTSIPADKKFWNTGDVLEHTRHTKGKGIKIVFFNDCFNQMEMAVGGVYETTTKETADMIFSMPVMQDYKEYFDVCILMTVWNKSGLYNVFPLGGYHSPSDGRQNEFLSRIRPMPQLQGTPMNQVTGFYYANGQCGGFMSSIESLFYAAYSYTVEPGPPGWMIHEFMGHAFSLLGDMYDVSEDLSTWNFFPKTVLPVTPVSDDPIGDLGPWNGPNLWITEWSQEAWDAFINASPDNEQYAANIDEYRMPLPANYRQKHPDYTGGDYIWRIYRTGSPIDCMVQHPPLHTSGWDRYLVYRRIKRLAGETYSLPEFFAQDLKYLYVTDWPSFLGLRGWNNSILYNAHATGGSPFKAWDKN